MSPRHDPFIFYAIAVSSLLESTVDTFVHNLKPLFGNNKELYGWLEGIWLPEELEHGKLTKEYLGRIWPEFNWDEAYSDFYRIYEPRCRTEELRKTPGLEALARCVTETEAAMFYRCISNYTNDHELKSLMNKMSKDEIKHYTKLRKAFEYYNKEEGNGFLRRSLVVFRRSQLVRDEDIAIAFSHLSMAWKGPKPFPELTYSDFLKRMSYVMKDNFPVEEAKRMLFEPLKTNGFFNSLAISIMAFLVKKLYPGMT
jgi:hypothetical protein